MKKTNEKIELNQRIAFLKTKQAQDFLVLKEQYHTTIDSFKPMNLIKNSFQEMVNSPDLKSNLITGVIGLGTNYVSKNLLNENSINPIKRVLGKVLKFAIKNILKKTRNASLTE